MGTAKGGDHGKAKGVDQGKLKNIERLNIFLRGEIGAVDTYKLALDALERTSKARSNLESCLQSHQQRVSILRAAIEQLGGQPALGSGTWEALARIVEDGTTAAGDKAAVAALEEGEDHGLSDYRRDIASLDASARQLIEMQILPKQIQTHHTMSELKKQLH